MDVLSEMTDEQLESLKRKRFGLYRGIVRDIEDPEDLGRVKAEVPELLGGGQLTDWASYCSPFGGGGAGFFMLPRPGDGVWVMFERGRATKPVWVGFWYSGEDARPEGAGPEARMLRTKSGHSLTFGDEEGSEFIEVTGKGGSRVRIDSVSGEIIIEAGQVIRLGSDGSAESLVLGDSFRTLFNALVSLINTIITTFDSHTHTGNEGSPTSSPLALIGQTQQPMGADLLSAKAKTER